LLSPAWDANEHANSCHNPWVDGRIYAVLEPRIIARGGPGIATMMRGSHALLCPPAMLGTPIQTPTGNSVTTTPAGIIAAEAWAPEKTKSAAKRPLKPSKKKEECCPFFWAPRKDRWAPEKTKSAPIKPCKL
jgi:hypothetical protein